MRGSGYSRAYAVEDGIDGFRAAGLEIVPNEPRTTDVRFVCATNHDMKKLVGESKFREDLYFRIKGATTAENRRLSE